MVNNIFHNNKVTENKINKKQFSYLHKLDKKNVDINKLLNRVKMNQQDEKKKLIVFFSYGILLLTFMGIFISTIK
jgi:hypothetical protein